MTVLWSSVRATNPVRYGNVPPTAQHHRKITPMPDTTNNQVTASERLLVDEHGPAVLPRSCAGPSRGDLDTIHLTRDSSGLWSWRRRTPHGCLRSEGSPQVDRGLALADMRGRNGYRGYTLVVGRE